MTGFINPAWTSFFQGRLVWGCGYSIPATLSFTDKKIEAQERNKCQIC